MLDIVTTESPRFTMLDIVTIESPWFTMLDIGYNISHSEPRTLSCYNI
jgi:hypothetical protein